MAYFKYILESISLSCNFNVPQGTSRNFQITSNLNEADKWKAKILIGNSMEEGKKVGDWDNVGYIMISLKDNTIIPIARSDEHRRGYELLSDYYHLSSSDYYSLWVYGKNYPYNLEDLKNLEIALQKAQSYGLVFEDTNPIISFYYLKNYYPENYPENYPDDISAKDYFANAYNERKPADISEKGKEFVQAFELIASCFEEPTLNKRKLKNQIKNLYKVGSSIGLNSNYAQPFISPIEYEEMLELVDFEDDDEKLWDAFFSFNGWRNKFHQRLRRNINNIKLNNQLGNVAEVIQLMSRI